MMIFLKNIFVARVTQRHRYNILFPAGAKARAWQQQAHGERWRCASQKRRAISAGERAAARQLGASLFAPPRKTAAAGAAAAAARAAAIMKNSAQGAIIKCSALNWLAAYNSVARWRAGEIVMRQAMAQRQRKNQKARACARRFSGGALGSSALRSALARARARVRASSSKRAARASE